MMTYIEALDYLYSRLPMYQRQGKTAYKADLNNTIALLNALKKPQHRFKSIHIAGTNGKGTSAHAIAAILQLAGYKVGLYTSPHLKEFTERIRINGKEIARESVGDFVNKTKCSIERINPSFFEVTVAMAFQYFADEQVDIAVIETGLGGRLDSTNVITPEVCLITNIGLDHTDLLGDTIEKIAAEKAGIIKPKVPVVIGDMNSQAANVMKKFAERMESTLVETTPVKNEECEIPYFEKNIPGVLGVIEELRNQGWSISEENEQKGLENFITITHLKGRYQQLQESPKVVADVSHNLDGLKVLFNHINHQIFSQLHIIFGTVKGKKLDTIFSLFPKKAICYFTQSSVLRSLDVKTLKLYAEKNGLVGETYENVNDAKKTALGRATPDDLILITGSTFIVSEIAEL